MGWRGKHVVPFKAPSTFERFGIDWRKDATTEPERTLRDAFLTHESSCGPDGLVSLLLLATVSRRQGSVAADLQSAADFAEILLALKVRPHQDRVIASAHSSLDDGGIVW